MQPRAFRNSLNHTVAFIRDLDRARNFEDVSAQVLRHVAPFGVEFMAATTVPTVGTKPRDQLSHVLFNRWPAEWLKRYASRGYVFCDPAFARIRSNPTPFFWNELDTRVGDDPMARRVMDEGSEFGLKEGFTVSLVTLDGQPVIWSLGGPHLEIGPGTRAMLTLIASYATARAIALQQESSNQSKKVTLSPREREALQWAAEGKGDWEIGEVMNISEHGADKHLRSVRVKLGAINRTQAVAEGIRRGLIA
ncbi:MAG TPA: LuxR family transcriptional regulator [Methylocella sp.]|nr:LuxR family transcriptional regulator [Methylocella sp.]